MKPVKSWIADEQLEALYSSEYWSDINEAGVIHLTQVPTN